MGEIYVDYDRAVTAASDLAKGEAYTQCPRLGYSYVHLADPSHLDEIGRHVRSLNEEEYAPGCYVGAVFHRLGANLTDMVNVGGALSNARRRFADIGIFMTDKAYFFLDTLQLFQDDGKTWSEAYRNALLVTDRQYDRLDDSVCRKGGESDM